MHNKRTELDFSKHELRIIEEKGLLVHFLQIPKSYYHCIKFINTNGILAVTGDYGNWIFCREFIPSSDGYVSEGYWLEKLINSSTQKPMEFDPQGTEEEIRLMLNGGIEKYGYDIEEANQLREYWEYCLRCIDDELEFTNYSYREYPPFMDSESVIFCKKHHVWLDYVFDAFEEICKRLK